MQKNRHNPQSKFLGNAPSQQWLYPAAVFTIAALVTAVLVEGVLRRGSLTVWDPPVTCGALGLRAPWLTSIAQIFTFMGTAWFLVPVAALLVVTLIVKAQYLQGLIATSTMLTGLGLTSLLKHLIGRDRPPFFHQIGDFLGSYAFPSGHTLNTFVVIGVLTYFLARGHRRWRNVLVIFWLIHALLVGASRIYLGYHWLTDILGGLAIGLAVLCVGYAALLFTTAQQAPHQRDICSAKTDSVGCPWPE
ncbi:phosphatase PAP2 family protein [Trueperella pecoris]|uniref:phosphatase PAP2 family protein n=1 Tax=Trueperella pecoris TaxID=2733571 RepID=UPI00186B6432|nr:phosphatase PAP2 family protein [Trueperella pecoris]QOQ38665.1 phosphatase PAP2 family protein [Trueperella pecoris]